MHERTAKVKNTGWRLEQSATNRYQQRFRQTNKAKQKFLSSSTKHSQAAVPGWTL